MKSFECDRKRIPNVNVSIGKEVECLDLNLKGWVSFVQFVCRCWMLNTARHVSLDSGGVVIVGARRQTDQGLYNCVAINPVTQQRVHARGYTRLIVNHGMCYALIVVVCYIMWVQGWITFNIRLQSVCLQVIWTLEYFWQWNISKFVNYVGNSFENWDFPT